MGTQVGPRVRLVGGLLLWYGVLGGAVAWAVHLMAAWSMDELTCAAGSAEISALPLWQAVGLAVIIPALAAAGSLAVAALAWTRMRQAQRAGAPDGAYGRARLLAAVGIWANLLFLSIIVLGGVALLVLPVCQR
ncbi:hypothetical protein ABZ671_07350 [Micromonospora sp. NPDC006766]|uniref:hypothetical protein n=1 Tax=Micromonospora sp. NPDC006766 TaxID=3154778 RepID=UPI0033E352EE